MQGNKITVRCVFVKAWTT